MLPREARWFAEQIAAIGDSELFPMLNVGSHTEEFRETTQPWINDYLFRPFAKRGLSVEHTDIQAAPGVDLVGDLTDPDFQSILRSRRYQSVFCNNLLEHVTEPERICNALVECVSAGGYLLLSVPHRFPYHPDPIDTMFRPSPDELAGFFPNTKIVKSKKLVCGNLATYSGMRLIQNSRSLAQTLFERSQGKTGADRATPQQRQSAEHIASGTVFRFLPWLIRPFVISCLILQVKS